MAPSPYSIYVKKRPHRTAFLVEDRQASMDIIDAVLAYNRDRWGGRYNPIVLTDGQTLSDPWWSLLQAFDPDVVASFVPLSDGLVARIERGISPYLIQQMDRRDPERINVVDDGLTVLPTPVLVRRASWASGQSNLVLFETDRRNTDPAIKRFIDWNFGSYSTATQAVERALTGVTTTRYTITDATSVVEPLTAPITFRPFTYPIQLCSLPNDALPPVQHERFQDAFTVVVGDSPVDAAYFWNRPATLQQWERTHLKQAWLPLAGCGKIG